MTALALSPNRSNPLPLLALAIIIVAVAGAVTLHHHAWSRHSTEAAAVRACQQRGNGNPIQVWRKFGSDRYHCIFPMGGDFGDMLVQPDEAGNLHEISSFRRWEATLDDVMESLAKEARMIFPSGGMP